jgi:integrase
VIIKRDKRWAARIYDPRQGKSVWVGTYATRAEAKVAEAEAINALERTRVRGAVTCDGFAETWTERFPRPRESTNTHNAERVKPFARDFKGRRLNSLTRSEARDWALEHPGNVPAVRAMLNDAVRDDLLDANPFEDLRLKRSRGRRDLVVPTVDEVAGLVEAARTTHGVYGERVYANLIQFAAYSGLRLGEVFGLRREDVDTKARSILVERQWLVKQQRFGPTKSGLARRVFLTDEALDAFERVPASHSLPELFLTPRGKRFSGGSVTYWWHPVRAAAGMPEFPFHGLRHFFGTYLANMNVGPIQIAKMMGHQDGGKLAMELYIHVTEQDAMAEVARRLGSSGPRSTSDFGARRAQRRAEGA